MNNNRVIKVRDILNFIFYFFLLFPFFQIPYLYITISFLPKLYTISLIIVDCVILFLLVSRNKYKSINNYIILFMAILFLSSAINGVGLSNCIGLILKVLGLSFLCNYGISKDRKIFFKAFEFLLCVLIIVNFISIVMYPGGLYMNETGYIENWFLGYKNSHILYILPYILISFLNSYIDYNKLKSHNYVMLVLSIISTLLVNNSTAIVGLVVIVFFLFFYKSVLKWRIFNTYSYLIIFISLFFLIIVFRFQEMFSFFIVDILHKDITFTGRTLLWDKAIATILNKPVLGYGNISFQYSKIVFSTHNMILGLLHKVGIIGTSVFIAFLSKVCGKLNQFKNDSISKFIGIVILSYFVMMTTESYNFEYVIYIFIIAFNVEEFIKSRRNNNETNIAS